MPYRAQRILPSCPLRALAAMSMAGGLALGPNATVAAEPVQLKLNRPANTKIEIRMARRPWQHTPATTSAGEPTLRNGQPDEQRLAFPESESETAPTVTPAIGSATLKLRPIESAPAQRVDKTPTAAARRPAPVSAIPSQQPTEPKASISDSWVARDAINRPRPLTDPKPAPVQVMPPDVEPKSHLTEPEPDSQTGPADPTPQLPPPDERSQPKVTPRLDILPRRAEPPAIDTLRPQATKPEPEKRELVEPELMKPKVSMRTLQIDRDGRRRQPDESDADASGRSADAEPSDQTSDERVARLNPRHETRPSREQVGDLLESPAVDVDDDHRNEDGNESEVNDVDLDFTGRPATPIRLQRNVAMMKPAIRQVLRYFHARPEVATGRSNWGMMHAIMVYGADTKVRVGRRRHSTIAWIAGNNLCRGKRILTEGAAGIEARSGVGLQGHQAQLLAVLSLAGVPESYPLYVGRRKYTVADLVDREAALCRSGEELTFSLIGLSHYMDTDATWTTDDGETWDFERLIAEELAQPIVGVACGGTHRLMGFGHALRQRRMDGLPIDGQWLRAERFLTDFVQYTYRLQNRDGSFSTQWFEHREDNGDVDRKVQTTGHIVEFLLTVTPDDQLQDRRLVAAIRFLLTTLRSDLDHDWDIGPKGHALRSLAMYHDRVFGGGPAWR